MSRQATLDPSDSGSTELEDDALERFEVSPDLDGIAIDMDPVILEQTVDNLLYKEAIDLCRERLSRADRILLLIQDGRVLELKESYGSKAAFVIMKEDISQAIVRRVRRKKRAIVISDALSDDELGVRQSVKKIGQRSVLCTPITHKGQTMGILYADSISLVGAFSQSELRWSIRLARALGKSLASATRGLSAEEKSSTLKEFVQPLTSGFPWGKEKAEVSVISSKLPPKLRVLPKPSASDKVVFLRSLACMLSSGFPIYGALDLLSQSGSRFAPYAALMTEDVSKGHPLSSAMSRFPNLFGKDYLNLVAVGEKSGTLDLAMVSLADNEESLMVLRAKVLSALTYPLIIFLFCLIGCLAAPPLFLNEFFRNLSESNVELPFITKVVMTASSLMWNPLTWIVGVGTIFAAHAGWQVGKKKKRLRLAFENLLLRLSIFGEMYRDICVLKFIRALAIQLEAGLYLDKSLKLAADASGCRTLKREVNLVVDRILAGESFAFALTRTEFFPATFVEFVNVGEETGRMSEMCHFVETLLANKTENSIEMTQALIEPLAMALVGILVGVVALACLLPLVQMIQNFI